MSFFISEAWAQGGAPGGGAPAGGGAGGGLTSLIFLFVIFIVFYFLLIRPQAKRAKEHKKMVQELAKGDEIVTNGGLLGKITELGENFIIVEVADGVQVKLQRQSVAGLMPKGTIKTL